MFKMNIPDYISECIDVLASNGYEAFLVGGCVRDVLMGKQPHDYDMTSSASPEEMLECFKGYRVVPTGLKHGTLTVICRGENLEITTYRIDGKYSDNRHPESVSFTRNLSEDLSRRDFTVNAMAYNPSKGLVDLFGGERHLKERKIVCVGEPDVRFGEDGLRIMRGLRFSSVLCFEIQQKTAESIHKNRGLLKNIAAERIYAEFSKLLMGRGASDIICNYSDVLQVFLPEISDNTEGIELIFSRLDSIGADLVTRIACLFRHFGIGSEAASEIMKRLKTDRDSETGVSLLIGEADVGISPEHIQIKRFLKNKTRVYAERYFGMRAASAEDESRYSAAMDCLKISERIYENRECLSLKELNINGGILSALGCHKGKAMGDILSCLLDEVISDELQNDAAALQSRAKELIQKQ